MNFVNNTIFIFVLSKTLLIYVSNMRTTMANEQLSTIFMLNGDKQVKMND